MKRRSRGRFRMTTTRPSLKTVMDAIGKLNKRFDDIEAGERGDDDDGEKPKNRRGHTQRPGGPMTILALRS